MRCQGNLVPIPRRVQQALLLACALLFTACSKPLDVVTVEAEHHRIEVSFTERAETLLRHDFPVSMPINGRIERIELEVGDRVREGEVLVTIDSTPALQEIDTRRAGVEVTKVQKDLSFDTTVERSELARAKLAVESVLVESSSLGPSIKAAETNLDNAVKEFTRIENLVNSGALPTRDAESAQLRVEQAKATLASRNTQTSILQSRLNEARAAVRAAEARVDMKLKQAQAQEATITEAQSRQTQAEYTLEKSTVVSPIDGVVLVRSERGPKELLSGAPLLTLGRTEDIEAECDVLSQDALRISRGTPVFLDAGGPHSEPIRGEVRLKEPQGFTKRSSLGVEQQRVRVRIGLMNPPDDLGAGYELWARFQLAEKTALTLPRSCFVKKGQGFEVWRVTAEKTLETVEVELGLQGDDLWELQGTAVKAGDHIVQYPTEELKPGAEVNLSE